ncbi:MAG: formylglycine-generating enzyme family protein [Kofleriaceae bacterium]|nr:formylglycine-generating enzyme family protein [Kofleriaceae bacterium]
MNYKNTSISLALVWALSIACDSGSKGATVDGGISQDASSSDAGFTDGGSVANFEEVLIPAGTFAMGSPDNEPGHDSSERQHMVTITRPFMMMASELSQGEWRKLITEDPPTIRDDDHPVARVSWNDALFYANALSEAKGLVPCYDLSACDGTPGFVGSGATFSYFCPATITFEFSCEGYRLPTEAEWEYAARAGDTGSGDALCDGDRDIDAVSCRSSGAPGGYTSNETLEHEPNDWGLYETDGNVGEWVWDKADSYSSADQVDPKGPAGFENRVYRGGGWTFNARGCRLAHRNFGRPSCHNDSVGFRLVRTILAD